MKAQIRGSVKINASGKSLYSFINALHEEDISCFEQYVKGGVFSGVVYRTDLKLLTRLADEYGIELRSFEYETLSSAVISRRGRFGLIAGIVLAMAAFFYFSSVILTIEVQGNERVSSEMILSALEDIDIHRGTPFSQINYILAENQLRLLVDDVAWAGMHRSGSRLVVQVTEVREKPEMLMTRIPCNIVAARDGKLTYTLVQEGQLMRKVGDYVRAGDLLVTGVVTYDTGRTALHHARAELTGEFEQTAEFSVPMTRERMTASGRAETRRKLELLSFDIPLYFGRNRYEYRSCEEHTGYLRLFGKTLPIAVKSIRYTELDRSEVTLSEEEVREELMEKVFLYEKNFLSGCEILDRDMTESADESVMTVTVKYKLSGEMGKQMEILAK